MNRRQMLLWWGSLVVLAAGTAIAPVAESHAQVAGGGAAAGTVNEATVKMVLAGLKDGRDRLRTGAFIARGRKSESIPGVQANVTEAEMEYFGAFDNDASLFRFDSKLPIVGGGTAPESNPTTEFEQRKYVRTPVRSLVWSSFGERTVMRYPADIKLPGTIQFVDIRCAGLISVADLENNTEFPWLHSHLSSQKVIAAEKESNGLYRLVWEFGNSGVYKRTVWFDPRQSYAPLRMELREGSLSKEPIATVETTWREQNKVWIPETTSLERHKRVPVKIALSFDWLAVNEPIKPETFTEVGLDLPHRSVVVSRELGVPVRVGEVEDGKFRPIEPPRRFENSVLRWTLVALTIGLVILATGYGLYRKFQASPTGKSS